MLPGTIVHETLHYVVGLVTGARPFNFNVVPNVTESSICYGSVDFENFNTFNATPTALAPLLAIPLALFAWPYVQGPHGFWGNLAIIWVFGAVLAQSLPSRADWAIALRHPVGLVLWTAIPAYLLM